MLEVVVLVLGASVIVVLGTLWNLNARLNKLEVDETSESDINFEWSEKLKNSRTMNIGYGYEEKEELTNWEITQLSKFVHEYLEREPSRWVFHEAYFHDRVDRKPVKSYQLGKLQEELFQLRGMVLDSEQMESARAKFELEKEIERKQEELEEME